MSDTKRRVSEFLPEVLQTDVLRKFFAATADHLFQPEKIQYLNNYIGQKPSWYNPNTDFYVEERSKLRNDYQVEPTAVGVTPDSAQINQILFYEDLLNRLRFQGALVDDHNRLFEQEYYSFGLPCDTDMWLNFNNYVWLESGPDAIILLGTTNLADIGSLGSYTYTGSYFLESAPQVIVDGTTDPLVFSSGLRIKPTLDLDVLLRDKTFIVEDVGRRITFVDDSNSSVRIAWDVPREYDSTPWDTTDRYSNPAYLLIQRGSRNQNPWSVRNRWFHIDILEQSGTRITNVNALRAKRPIIQFSRHTTLWNFGTQSRGRVDLVDKTTTNLAQLVGQPPVSGNTVLSVDGIPLDDGMTLLFTNLSDAAANNRLYQVNGLRSDQQLTLRLLPNSGDANGTPVTGDSVYVAQGNPQGIYVDSYWRYSGAQAAWVPAQSYKLSVPTQAPLFELYDTSGVALSDPTNYPLSSFSGNTLFSYATDPTEIVDPILGLRVVRDTVQSSDFVFENTLVTQQYSYQPRDTILDIEGFKFWLTTDPVSGELTYYNNWFKSAVLSRQYVVNQYVSTESQRTFDLDQPPSSSTVGPSTINVVVDGTTLVPAQYSVADKKLTLNIELKANQNITIKTWNDVKNTAVNGFFEIPNNLQANANNQEVTTVTRSRLIAHLISVISNQTNIKGTVVGSNNWRDTAQDLSMGTVILQHRAPMLKLMMLNAVSQTDALTSSTALLDPMAAMQWAQREYLRFYNKFLTALINLYNQQGLTASTPINQWVSRALTQINVGKTLNSPWAMSGFDGAPGAYCSSPSSNPTFVPANATRLGVTGAWQPLAFFDSTQPNSPLSLRCHNGAIVVLRDFNGQDLGTIVDGAPSSSTPEALTHPVARAWIQFETLMYSNLPIAYRNPDRVRAFDTTLIFSGKWRRTNYTRDDLLFLMYPIFERWVTVNQLDAFRNTTYDVSDPFSWNYSSCVDADGDSVPGHWRGIYYYFFDTVRPHTAPWEMLGFTQKPTWWDSEYGPSPYTSGNSKMWFDIRDGKIAQGENAGIYPAYARPTLMQYLPVNEFGELLPPAAAGIVTRLPSVVEARADWKFGDRSPLENVWLTSVEGDMIWAQVGYLAKPAQFIEYLWDGPRAELCFPTQTNSQWIWSNQKKRVGNSEFFVHRENPSEIPTLASDETYYGSCGIQHWISESLINDNRNVTRYFGEVIRSSNVRLGYRAGGFVDGNTIRVLADSFGLSNNASLLLPQEDVTNNLIRSASLREFFYTGVIVEARGSDGWRVIGYDSNDPVFTIIPSDVNGSKSTVVIDKARVVEYRTGLDVARRVTYGTVFRSQQEVYDFLVSLGRWQTSQGWRFEEFSSTTGKMQDWSLAAKEFLFWSQGPWAPGTFISLSPLATMCKFKTSFGTIQNVGGIVNGTYTILDKGGRPIQPQNADFLRIDDEISVRPTNDQGIYGIRLYTTSLEHAFIFNNNTIFGDVIYDPLFDLRQSRFKLLAYRSMDWNGRLEAPGYMVTQNTQTIGDRIIATNRIIANYEKSVDDIRRYYNIDVGTPYSSGNAVQQPNQISTLTQALDTRVNSLAKHLVGYQRREYLTNLLVDDTTQFQFYQGMIRQKGTAGSIEKILRNTNLVDSDESFSYYEEFAFRVGDYGSNNLIHGLDIVLPQDQVRSNPQLVEIFSNAVFDLADDNVITIIDGDPRIINQTHTTPQWALRPYYGPAADDLPTAGYVLFDEVDYSVVDDAALFALYNKLADEGLALQPRQRIWKFIDRDRSWDIYRVCQPNWSIITVAPSIERNNFTTVTTNRPHGLSNGAIVILFGLTGGSIGVEGTYRINNPTPVAFDIEAFSSSVTTTGQALELRSVRFENYNAFQSASIPGGWTQNDVAYIDGTDVEPWRVLKRFGVWFEFRKENLKIDTGYLLNSQLYNRLSLATLQHLQVFDPVKGAIPGIAAEEINYRTSWDPAQYNAGDPTLFQVDPANTWGPTQVGQTWWDTSTTRFIDYEIGTDSYRRQHWGKVAPGISVDVYEWIRSTVPPSAWAGAVAASNTAATGGNALPTGQTRAQNYPYVMRNERNVSGLYANVYYFWVKNKTTVPEAVGRKLSVSVISQIIAQPENQNIAWWAAISNTGALIGNINRNLDGNNTVWQFNYTSKAEVDKIYKQWTLLRPNDPSSTPTVALWQRMMASLLEFDSTGNSVPNLRLPEMMKQGASIRPSQSWFRNSNTARRTFVERVNNLLRTSPVPPADDPDRTSWLDSFNSSEPPPPAQNIKTSVRAATTAALNTIYFPGNNGRGSLLTFAGSINEALIIDGVALQIGDRVLVKNQAPASVVDSIVVQQSGQNGIYEVVDVGAPPSETDPNDLGRPWVLVRASDFDSVDDNLIDAQVTVTEGVINLFPRPYRQVNPNIAIIGKDPIIWEKGLAPRAWEYSVANLAERDALQPSLAPSASVLVAETARTNSRWTIWQYTGREFVLVRMQAWKTHSTWSFVDWYASGYGANSLVTHTVDTLADREQLVNLQAGQLVKVQNTGNGRWNLFAYQLVDDEIWTTVGVENGNVALSDNLYDYAKYNMGFDGGSYATDFQGWEYDTRLELAYIIDGLWNFQNAAGLLKTTNMLNERNSLFFEMVQHVLAEQTFVDWCFKTSFITLKGFSQQLLQTSYYNPSKIENLEKYIQEIKPYHTIIRQFVDFRLAQDSWNSASSDFDRPPYQDSDGSVRILNANNPIDVAILQNSENYKYWTQGHQSSNSAPIESKTLLGNGVTKQIVFVNPVSWQFVQVRWNNKLTSDWRIAPDDATVLDLNFTPVVGDIVIASVYGSENLTVRTTSTHLLFDRLGCEAALDSYSPGYGPDTVVDRVVQTENALELLTDVQPGDIVKVVRDQVGLWSWFQYTGTQYVRVAYQLSNGAANRIQLLYQPTSNMPPTTDPLLISGCAPKGTVLDGLDFNLSGKWGEPVWDSVLGWDNSAQQTDRLLDQYINGGQPPEYWTFRGDGVTTNFALPQAPQAPNAMRVWVNGLLQTTPAQWTVKNWITNVEVANKGLGYSVNDILEIQGGQFTLAAKIRVTNTDALGAILGLAVIFPGVYSVTPSGTAATASGGTGINASFVLRWGGTSLEFAQAPSTATTKPNIWVAEAGSTFENPLGGSLDSIYDGLGLSRPHVEGGHPEELFPMFSRESLLINVENQPSPGFGNVLVESWQADGVTDRFFVGQPIFSDADLIVSEGGNLKKIGVGNDYVYDASSNSVVFLTAPTNTVHIVSTGFGGATPGLGTWSISQPGIDYALGDLILLGGAPAATEFASVIVTAIAAQALTITQPGSGYAVGDLLYFKYGSGTRTLVAEVTATFDQAGSAGQISGVAIVSQGYYTQPSVSTDEWLTNGNGTGCRITPRWGVADIRPVDRGAYQQSPGGFTQLSVTTSGGTTGTGTGFALSNLGGHISQTKTFVFDTPSQIIQMDAPIDDTNSVLMTWNGVQVFAFGVDPSNARAIGLGFQPLAGDTVVVVVYASKYQSLYKRQEFPIQLPSLAYQLITPPAPPPNPLTGFSPAESINAYVYANGRKLRAPYVTRFVGDGASSTYTLGFTPGGGSNVNVWINLTQLALTQYSLVGDQISLSDVVPAGNVVTIQVQDIAAQLYDYEITGTTITFAPWAVADGELITVNTFGEDSSAAFQNDIWPGVATNAFQFSKTPLSFQSIQVWLNNQPLALNIDYLIEPQGNAWFLKINPAIPLNSSDRVEAYYPTALPSKPAIAFSCYTNVYGETQYLRMGNSKRTVLTADLKLLDTEVFVANGDVLANPTDKRPGVIWIGSERIEYFEKAPNPTPTLPAGAVLRKLNRGTLGTASGVEDKFISQWWSTPGGAELFLITVITPGEWLAGQTITSVKIDTQLVDSTQYSIEIDPPNAAAGLYLKLTSDATVRSRANYVGLTLFKQDWNSTDTTHQAQSIVRDGGAAQNIPGGYQWPYGALGLQYSTQYQTEFLLSDPGTIVT